MTAEVRYALIFIACCAMIVYGSVVVTWWVAVGATAGMVLSVATMVAFWDHEEQVERVDGKHKG